MIALLFDVSKSITRVVQNPLIFEHKGRMNKFIAAQCYIQQVQFFFFAYEMSCLDISLEDKWSYSWDWKRVSKDPTQKHVWAFLSRVHSKADDGARMQKGYFMGILFVDVNPRLHLSRRLAGAGAAAYSTMGFNALVPPPCSVAVCLGNCPLEAFDSNSMSGLPHS